MPAVKTLVACLFPCLAVSAIPACGGDCRTLGSSGGVTGEIVYTTGDGTTVRTSQVDLWSTGTSTLELRARLGDRPVQILISGLADGTTRTLAHDDTAKACLPVQSGAAPTCLLLDGTVFAKKLRRGDCEGNENITFCEKEADVTIEASSKDHGLLLSLDLHVTSTVAWAPTTCR